MTLPARAAAPNVTSGLRALSDIAWMARRQAHHRDYLAHAGEFNDACWLLHQMARSANISLGHPDPTANRDWDEAPRTMTAAPSFFTDGTPVDYTPATGRVAELKAMDRAAAVQWIVKVIHPLALPYADGAATYAPGMYNDATRVLRNSGFDLSATEALGLSVWASDGMGDSFLRLSHAEIVERDAARATASTATTPHA